MQEVQVFMRRASFILWAIIAVTMVAGAAAYASPPTLTIDQWSGQPDPTNQLPIRFRVVFDQPVTDFTAGDIMVAGTAPGTRSISVIEVAPNNGTTYDVYVNGMTGSGTVIASIPAARVQNSAGQPNVASTSTHNVVNYDITRPQPTFSLAPGQASPTARTTPLTQDVDYVNFDMNLSKAAVAGMTFTTTDTAGVVTVHWDTDNMFSFSGSAAVAVAMQPAKLPNGSDNPLVGHKLVTLTGGGTSWHVNVGLDTTKLMAYPQRRIITINANNGAFSDLSTNASLPTTGQTSDNTVVIDYIGPQVSVNQDTLQSDPTNALPLHYTAVFSERVTDMSPAAVTLTGAGGSATVDVAEIAPFDGTTYDISVGGSPSAGTISADIGSDAVHDVAGNGNRASSFTDNQITYSPSARSVLITHQPQITWTKNSPINFTVAFSSAVTAFVNGSVTLSGTAAATTKVITNPSGDNKTFNLAISGMTKTGTVVVSVPAGSVTPGNLPSNTDVVTYDTDKPVVTIDRAPGQASLTNYKPVSFRLVFNEQVTGLTSSSITIGGTAPGTKTATINEAAPFNGTTYDVAITGMTGSGTIIASVSSDVALDLAGNGNLASGQAVVSYDVDSPNVTVAKAGTQSNPTNVSPINFTVTFSKSVSGFLSPDVAISGTAGATTAIVSGTGSVYNVAVSGMTGQGTVTISIPANVAQDGALNGNTPSTSADDTVLYDATAPTVTINQGVAQSDPARSSPVNFTVLFSEPVVGFGPSSVTLSGSAGATTAIVSDSGDHRTFNVAVSGMTSTGTVIASIGSGVVQDPAGNLNVASTSADNTVTYYSGPTVTVDQAPSQVDPASGLPINFTVSFSEPVTGFDASDVVLTGSAPGSKTVTITGSGATYNIAIGGLTGSGTVIVNIPAAAATSLSGQANIASTSVDNSVTYDITRPSVTIDQAAGQDDPTLNSPIRFTAVFSEPVVGFNNAAVTISGTAGATRAAVTNPSGDNRTFAIAVTGMAQDGTVTVTIPANAAADAVGNGNLPSSSTDNVVTYVTPLTVSVDLAGTQSATAAAGPIKFSATFSKAVSDFTSEDVSIVGTATFSNKKISVINSGDYKTYTISVTGMNSAGTVIASIGAGVAHDTKGFPNAASIGISDTVVYDPTVPTVTIEQALDQVDPTNVDPINFTVTFSSPVTGFTSDDVVIEGTAGGNLTATVTGSGADYNVAVSGMTTSGTVMASIVGGAAVDGNNVATPASTSFDNTVGWDVIRPTVTVNQADGQPDPATGFPINFTAVFSEPVDGLPSIGVLLGGTASANTVDVTEIEPFDGTTYNIAVSDIVGGGTVTVDIMDGATTDMAGNDCYASTSTDNSVTVPLTVTINQATGQSDPANTSPVNFTVVFSDPVLTFTNANVAISGTALPTTVVVGSSVDHRTYNVAVSGMSLTGTVVATIPAGVVTSTLGGTNLVSTSTDNIVTFDNVAPTITLTKAAGQADPTTTGPIRFTATFSESVSDFTASDVVVGGTAGASVATITGSGRNYAISVNDMQQTGTVTVSIPAGSAHDAAGNANAAVGPATVQYNNTVLRVTINQADSQADPTKDTPIHFTAIFTAAVTDFATGDVTLSGTAGATTATVSGSGTTYDIAVSGMTTAGTVVASIAAGKAHDSLNGANVVSTSSDGSVSFDNVKPTVTINQSTSQTDPTATSPISFAAVFSKVVTGFADTDVTLGGTAGATTAVVTDTGNHKNYTIVVSGMTGDGTVTASIAASVAQDSLGNLNLASSSTDNTVTYQRTHPTVTLAKATGQTDPTNASTIHLTATFSEAVTGFTSSGATVTGTATGTKTAVVAGSGTAYTIDVTGMTGTGTVIVTVPAGVATATSGTTNSSGSITLNYDVTGPTLAITAPTTAASCVRNTGSVTIAGTSSDSSGMGQITWSSEASGAGSCTGTTTWSSGAITVVGTSDVITITAQDTLGNTTTATLAIQVTPSMPGSAWRSMAMVSLPIIPDDTDPKNVVGFTGTSWSSYSPDINAYAKYPDSATMFVPASSAIGRGFWASFAAGASPAPAGIIPPQTGVAVIHLRPGWNLIGQPFIAAVTWNSATLKVRIAGSDIPLRDATDSVKNFAWGWTPTSGSVAGAYYLVTDQTVSGATTKLQPWQAYWIKAQVNCDLLIPAP